MLVQCGKLLRLILNYGGAYSLLSGYNIQLKQEEAFGWLAGFAYQIPEIALKASVTYRSEIKHKSKIF